MRPAKPQLAVSQTPQGVRLQIVPGEGAIVRNRNSGRNRQHHVPKADAPVQAAQRARADKSQRSPFRRRCERRHTAGQPVAAVCNPGVDDIACCAADIAAGSGAPLAADAADRNLTGDA